MAGAARVARRQRTGKWGISARQCRGFSNSVSGGHMGKVGKIVRGARRKGKQAVPPGKYFVTGFLAPHTTHRTPHTSHTTHHIPPYALTPQCGGCGGCGEAALPLTLHDAVPCHAVPCCAMPRCATHRTPHTTHHTCRSPHTQHITHHIQPHTTSPFLPCQAVHTCYALPRPPHPSHPVRLSIHRVVCCPTGCATPNPNRSGG